MFDGKLKNYPNLAQYLRQEVRQRHGSRTEAEVALGVAAAAAFVALGVLTLFFGSILVLFLGFAAMAAGFPPLAKKLRKPKTPEEMRAVEAQSVARVMLECDEKRRLHRDLDPASLELLEECARHWSRATATLDSSFWKGDELPLHYRAAREQARHAVQESMHEVMLLYRDFLPDQVTSRAPLDFVDEALTEYVFKKPNQGRFPPRAFEPVRSIADKLRMVADEVEVLSQEAIHDVGIPAPLEPGRALDATLGELRSIRQAEDELRQNLQG
jgi:hypothetical protein